MLEELNINYANYFPFILLHFEKLLYIDMYFIIKRHVHCSKQLEEQTKKRRKPSETPMYWHTMDSTRVLMRNTEKRHKKMWN